MRATEKEAWRKTRQWAFFAEFYCLDPAHAGPVDPDFRLETMFQFYPFLIAADAFLQHLHLPDWLPLRCDHLSFPSSQSLKSHLQTMEARCGWIVEAGHKTALVREILPTNRPIHPLENGFLQTGSHPRGDSSLDWRLCSNILLSTDFFSFAVFKKSLTLVRWLLKITTSTEPPFTCSSWSLQMMAWWLKNRPGISPALVCCLMYRWDDLLQLHRSTAHSYVSPKGASPSETWLNLCLPRLTSFSCAIHTVEVCFGITMVRYWRMRPRHGPAMSLWPPQESNSRYSLKISLLQLHTLRYAHKLHSVRQRFL